MSNHSYAKTSQIIPAEKYLELTAEEKMNIKSTSIIPPVLGKEGFGEIKIEYNYQFYKIILLEK